MNHSFKSLKYIFIVLMAVQNVEADTCPISPTRIDPEVSVDVKYDSQKKIYRYKYSVKNGSRAEVPLRNFSIMTSEVPVKTSAPQKWHMSSETNLTPNRFTWSSFLDTNIKKGKSIAGFVFESPNPPGPIIYYAVGELQFVPTSTPTADDDEPMPNCPELYNEMPYGESVVLGLTSGPNPPNQIGGKITVMFGKSGKKRPKIDPFDRGLVKVVLEESKQLDLSKVDIESLEFGIGRAQPTHHEISKKKLILHFDLDDVNIRCNLDRALFLTGKVGDKNLLAGAELDPVKCEPKHFRHQDEKREKCSKRWDSWKKKGRKMNRAPWK